jgi:hypothetical protein
MSAQIIALGGAAHQQRRSISPESIAFIAELQLAMAHSMAGRPIVLDMNAHVSQLITLCREVAQEPVQA